MGITKILFLCFILSIYFNIPNIDWTIWKKIQVLHHNYLTGQECFYFGKWTLTIWCNNFQLYRLLYIQGVDTPLHLPVGPMSTHGDILDPTRMRKFLFKLNLQLSDPSWNVISSKLPPLQIYSNPKLPVSIYFVQNTYHKANLLCICMCLLSFICFCHKRKCPWDRDHDSHAYKLYPHYLAQCWKKAFARYLLIG